MKRLVGVILSVVLVGALGAGCGTNKAVKAAEDMATAVCACKDSKCAMEAAKKGADELSKMANEKGTEADAKKIQTATEKMTKCMTDLAGK